ncbi:rRNA maturation RNase YbeY [Xanthobacter sediminis]|uniref:rRNA maturation RNase YbeY n=1 Tax=Xanthobacter sediminis TaxID=3119926 RepID=UPI00372C2818
MADTELLPPDAVEIDVLVEVPLWSALPDAEGIVVGAALAALAAVPEEVPAPAEMSITLTDDAHIQVLNREWRDMDKATNVLSFPAPELPEDMEDAPQPLGDVIVAFETLKREAELEDKAIAHHLTHLVVHGTLHLLGYDHIEDDEAEEMEGLERQILAGLGIDDPYRLPQDGG